MPKTINLNDFDVILNYNLFGVNNAEHTTKSFNDNVVYGGQAVKLDNSWKRIKEYIPRQFIKVGKNEIFFNRKANKNYLYKIKDVSISLIKKQLGIVFIMQNKLVNYNGNLHLLGYINEDIKEIKVLDQTVPVKNGVFEYLLKNIPKRTKTIIINFGKNDKQSTEFKVDYSEEKIDYIFTNSNINKIQGVSHKNLLGALSLNALTIEYASKANLTDNQLYIQGIDFDELKPLNSDIVNVTSGDFLGYRIKNQKSKDSSALKLNLKYDSAKIPEGYNDRDVRIFSFDKSKREWVVLPVEKLDFQNKTVISEFNGDTDYINGVIKVPEMSEIASFAPTTITDLEYANPSAAVVSIAPPIPNSNGTASTSFPIKLPSGRNGMAPSLSVQYNSDAGNGWMGVGWNLQLPAITIDTRWGAPRFETLIESEIYQLNGEMMVMKVGNEYTNPHRHDTNITRKRNRVFYLRKEGGFYKIVRIGSDPKNYRWEVTDKHGNKSFYGTTNNSKIYDASLNSGNITHWALYKTQDPYGNYVIYEYDKGIVNPDTINGINAQYFYPKTIKYTLKGTRNTNYFTVEFQRKYESTGNNSTLIREDAMLSARTGVMMATHQLLAEIRIGYVSTRAEKIRTYRFDYTENAFKKMQLSKISEYSRQGLFYTNTMEYYDEVEKGQLINTSSVNWNGISTVLGSPLLDMAPNGTPVPHGSALGTSTTKGFSTGLRFGIGLGTKVKSIAFTIGGSYNYSQSKQKTRISFLDINGDGLPDKVYKPNNGNLLYLPNLGIVNGQGTFGLPLSVRLSKLDNTKSKTNTIGVDANLNNKVGIGKSWSTTRTETDGYFTDFNGDGLPDIITNGLVKFNTTQPWTSPSTIGFSTIVDNTSNPITSGIIDTSLISNLDLETKDELRENHSQFDHIKVWTAPYTGNITIRGTAKLIAKNNCGNSSEQNQFRLTIERATDAQNTGIANQITIDNLTNVNQTKSYNLSQSVTKGDIFFFRIHNKTYGCGGELEWNPKISYSSSVNVPNTTNENGKQYRIFNAEDEFMMNNGGNWRPNKLDNRISSINWNLPNLSQYQFSDDFQFIIKKVRSRHITGGANDGQVDQVITTVWSKTYHHQNGSISTSNLPSNFYITSNQFVNGGLYSYEYRFYIESDSNVQWDKINWQPTVIGSSSGLHYAPVNYVPYDTNVNQSNYETFASSFPTPNIDTTIPNDAFNPLLRVSHNMFNTNYSQFIAGIEDEQFPIKINWVVKEEMNGISRVLHKRTFYLHKIDCFLLLGQLQYCTYKFRVSSSPTSNEIITLNSNYKSYFQYDLTKEKVQDLKNNSGKIYASFYLEHPEFGQNNNANCSIALHPNQQTNVFSTQTFNKPFISKKPAFYGWTYRGWGQFLYNGGLKFQYDNQGNIIPNTPPSYFDEAIDMSVFEYGANPNDIQAAIDNADIDNMDLNDVAVRYTFYTQDNQLNSYKNVTIKNNIDVSAKFGYNNANQLTSLLGRFAEHNIYDLWIDPATLINGNGFVGLKQRSKSKGKATSGNVFGSVGSVGASGTRSVSSSKILNQYLDLNGDRYPDLVTDGNIQFTSMKGGLSDLTIDNNFVVGSKSKDDTVGVTLAGVSPNSTSSDNNNTTHATKTNVESGINASSGNSYNSRQWIDINGDGLVDKVTIYKTEIRVQLNTGYGFTNEVVWGSGYINLFVSTRNNIGLGGGISSASWGAGFGLAESIANLNAALIDVNADGLPDLVIKTRSIYKFYLNNGTSFEPVAIQTFYNGYIDRDVSFTGNIYGTVTFGFFIKLLLFSIKFTFTPTVSVNAGVNEKRITVQDIDGDGYPDVLQNGDDNGAVIAKLNKVGKTNLLKTVNTPLGGSWTIDYKREGNTYNMSQSKWVLNNIKTDDGFRADNNFSPDKTLTTIAYKNPKHDRREREFLGFSEVKINQKNPTNQETFRYSISEYHNENIYLKGLLKRTAVYDSSDNLLNENKTLYSIMNPDNPQVNLYAATQQYLQTGLNPSLLDYSRLFTAPIKTVSTTYENAEGLSLEQQFIAYDNKGNLLTYKNLGDRYTSAALNDGYRTELEYYNSIPGLSNSIGFVKKIQVKRQNDGQLLREREAQYTNQGKLSLIKTKLNNLETNEVYLGYDTFGNLIKSTLQNGFETTFSYETDIHTYPARALNSFGEISQYYYDYVYGVPLFTKDKNNQIMRTRIDDRGRIVEITAPNEMPTGWTIQMQYEGEDPIFKPFNGSNYIIPAHGSFLATNPGSPPAKAKHYAVTRHHVAQAQGNQLLTISMVDGLGKAIQLKKTLYANTNSSNQLRWLVSGKEYKDAFGRVLKAYLPTYQTGYPTDPYNLTSSAFNYQTNQNLIPPTIMDYDSRDRVVDVKQPGETQSVTTSFNINDGMFLASTTNELGQTFETYTDVRGRQRKTVQNGELTTQFYYNTVGEKIKVKNHQGYDTFYKYDLAGRRIEIRHPDHGLQEFKYDVVGNLLQRTTSNLILNGSSAITYKYNFNRLKEVIYPENPENNISYTYGSVSNTDAVFNNAVGRLYLQKDASGVQGFGYDKLGNLNNHLRGVAVAGRHTFWYHTQWTYDSHNRVQNIVYPDGETVNYNYNLGGTLSNMVRTIPNIVVNNPIVETIEYNNLGERTAIKYGNGTSSFYTYDNRRRLKDLSHHFGGFEITNRYNYDALSNVVRVATNNPASSIPNSGQLGGPINQSYKYDNYNRLIFATGRYTGPNDFTTPLLAQEYTLNMTYDLAHNIISKTQKHIQGAVASYGSPITTAETMIKTNYHLEYGGYATGVNVVQGQGNEFGYVQPHAAHEIIETPDNTDIISTNPNYKKKLINYDANGNQISIKQVVAKNDRIPVYEGIIEQYETTLQKHLWDEEDRLRAVDLNPEDKSAHPLAVYTYDASGQRTVRYIPGRLDVRSNANNVSKNERDEVMIYPNALLTAKAISIAGMIKKNGNIVSKYTKHYFIGSERVNSTLGTVKNLGLYPPMLQGRFPTIRNLANESVYQATTGLVKTYTSLGQTISLRTPLVEGTIASFNHNANNYDAYWYHSDHLGSSSYITNLNGIVTQHMEYLPFGELMVDEHQNSNNTPYKFNGKELDDETGNYYYGARYYNPKFSIWLSVDPLTEKYSSISSYAYVAQNPLKYIDPNGKDIINADKLRLTRYKNQLQKYLNANKKYAGLSNKEIKAKFGKNGFNKSKHYKKRIRQTNRMVNTYTKRATKTDKVMVKWKEESHNLYDKIDNMNVDMYLGVDGQSDGAFGSTITNIKLVNGKYVFNSKEGANAIEVQINSGVNLSSKDSETGEYSLNHEGGHFIYNVENPKEYLKFMKDITAKGEDYNGGHHKDAPTGKSAKTYGSKKDIKN